MSYSCLLSLLLSSYSSMICRSNWSLFCF